jgi:hypothetical protein
VKDGILIGSGPGEVAHLYTTRADFRDFHLRAQVRINGGGNGGVYARASFGPKWPSSGPKYPYGYEAQISGKESAGGQTGSLFVGANGPVVDVRLPLVPTSQWFSLDVRAEGNRVVVMVNEQVTADYVDPARRFLKGRIALQKLNPETIVEFRKIEVRELNRERPSTQR